MKKIRWNILVNLFSFVVFMLMISTGLLLNYILPPGSGRVEKMLSVRGGRSHQVIELFLGLARHEWGVIHYYLSLSFLCLMIVHIILHWSWIQSVTFGTKKAPQSVQRKVLVIFIVLFIGLMIALPWIIPTETFARQEFQQMRSVNY